MIIAANIKKANDFGVQLIMNDSGMVMGVNLICAKRILVKHRFIDAIKLSSINEENKMVNEVITRYFLK